MQRSSCKKLHKIIAWGIDFFVVTAYTVCSIKTILVFNGSVPALVRVFCAARLKIRLNIVFRIKKNPETIAVSGFLYGGQYRTRTCDPMHVKSHPFVFYCILIIIREYFR